MQNGLSDESRPTDAKCELSTIATNVSPLDTGGELWHAPSGLANKPIAIAIVRRSHVSFFKYVFARSRHSLARSCPANVGHAEEVLTVTVRKHLATVTTRDWIEGTSVKYGV